MTKSKKLVLPRFIKLELKADHLKRGVRSDPTKCAVARAFHSAGYRYVQTDTTSTEVYTKNYKSIKFIAMHNKKTHKLIRKFDHGKRDKIKPQTLTFKVVKPIPVMK